MIFRKGGLIVFEDFLNWHEHLLCGPRDPCWTLQELSRRWSFWGDGDNAAARADVHTFVTGHTRCCAVCREPWFCRKPPDHTGQRPFFAVLFGPAPVNAVRRCAEDESSCQEQWLKWTLRTHASRAWRQPWARKSIAQGSATPQKGHKELPGIWFVYYIPKALRSHGALCFYAVVKAVVKTQRSQYPRCHSFHLAKIFSVIP